MPSVAPHAVIEPAMTDAVPATAFHKLTEQPWLKRALPVIVPSSITLTIVAVPVKSVVVAPSIVTRRSLSVPISMT